MAKKYVKQFIILVLTGILAIGLFVYLVDPFYHYHEPLFGMEPYLYNAVYQTPGVARNLEYDSVILGSSMTENFRTGWFDEELGWDTVKLSYSGARTDDLAAIMGQIFVDGRNVDNVVLDINDYQLLGGEGEVFVERPEYLYDDNVFNDVKYLLNKDVIWASCGRVIATIMGAEGNMDSAYCWEDAELFGIRQVQDAYFSDKWQRNAGENTEYNPKQIEESVKRCVDNIAKIQCFIKDNPDTQFYIFCPPYSMAYWQGVKEDNRLEEIISIYSTAIETFLQYDNVSLYYFQDEIEFISELNNYRDLCHYKPEMNRYIFESIRDNSNRVDENNYKEKLYEMYKLADRYDYEEIWE